MPARKIVQKVLLFALLLSGVSCVKDVDLDQYEEITVPPTVALDLIYFKMAATDFGSGTGQPATVTDEVRLEFLDDDYIQDGLRRADFNFRFTNSFNRPFTVTFKFLSESGAVKYTIVIEVPAGVAGEPAVVDYTEIVSGARIADIQNSISLLVEVEMESGTIPSEGELQLESKAYFTFDF